MPTQSAPPEQPQHGWSATAVALSIFLSGMAVVVALVVWELTRSNHPTTAVAAPVVPAATQGTAGSQGMASMPGMEATAPQAASTAAAAAEPSGAAAGGSAAAPAHKAYDAALRPSAPAPFTTTRSGSRTRSLDIAPGVRYQGWTFDGSVARAGDPRAPGRLGRRHARERRRDPAFDRFPRRAHCSQRVVRVGARGRQPALPLPCRDAGRLHVPLRHAAGARTHRERHVRRDRRRSQGGLAAGGKELSCSSRASGT